MPAQGGSAAFQQRRRSVQRQNPRVQRAAQTAGHQGRALQDTHGTAFRSTSFLKQRGHRPGQDPGSYDPRWAATSQRWSAATRSAGRTEGGFEPRKRNRWWQTDDLALSPDTAITHAWGVPGRTVTPGSTVTEAYQRRMNERWGTGSWETLDPFARAAQNLVGGQAGGGALGSGYF